MHQQIGFVHLINTINVKSNLSPMPFSAIPWTHLCWGQELQLWSIGRLLLWSVLFWVHLWSSRLDHWIRNLAATTMSCWGLWEWRWVTKRLELNMILSSNSLPKVLSAHRITLTLILIIWGRWISSKSRRGLLLQCNSQHLMLSHVAPVPATTWQSRTVANQPWWRRPAAPPCRPPSPAQATASRFTFTLIAVAQSLVGGSPGEQWHQVPEHLYIRLSDSVRSCLWSLSFYPKAFFGGGMLKIANVLFESSQKRLNRWQRPWLAHTIILKKKLFSGGFGATQLLVSIRVKLS